MSHSDLRTVEDDLREGLRRRSETKLSRNWHGANTAVEVGERGSGETSITTIGARRYAAPEPPAA